MSEKEVIYLLFHQVNDNVLMTQWGYEFGWWEQVHWSLFVPAFAVYLRLIACIVFEINIFIYWEDLKKGVFFMISQLKRFSPLIMSIALVFSVSLSSIDCKADTYSGFFKAITSEIFEEQYGSTALGWVSPQFSRTQSYFSGFSSQDYENFNDVSSLPINPLSDRVIYSLGGWNSATGNVQLIMLDFSSISGDLVSNFTNSAGITVAVNNSSENLGSITGYYWGYSTSSHSWYQIYAPFTVTPTRELPSRIVPTFVNPSDDPSPNPDGKMKVSVNQLISNDYYNFYNYSSSALSYLFYTNCQHYYNTNQFWDVYVATDSVTGSTISNNFGKLNLFDSLAVDYLDGGFSSYFNGNEVITPDRPDDDVVIENNTNHLYLKNVNAGFCKPKSMKNLSGVGGGYIYISYDFDDWINYHNSSYDFQITSDFNIDDTHSGTIIRQPLDLQGVTVLPFSDLATLTNWNNENIIFVESNEQILSTYNLGYVYSMPYMKFVENRNVIQGNMTPWVYLTTIAPNENILGYDLSSDFTSAIENLFISQVNHTKFTLTITCKLIDKVSGEESGTFSKTFNLLNGVQNTTSKTIEDNQNPFENSDDDVQLPIDNEGGGYNTIGYGAGNNNQIVNFTTPSDIRLYLDNGLQQFIDLFNSSPDTQLVTNSFWSSFGIFENNPVHELYKEYFDGVIPDDLKDVLIGCATIGIVGGVFCCLRRKLT